LNDLTVQCLPGNIPSKVEVDVTPLVTAEALIRIKDLPVIPNVTIINEPGVVVARIAVEVVEVVEKPKTAEEAAAEGTALKAPQRKKALLLPRVKRKKPRLKRKTRQVRIVF